MISLLREIWEQAARIIQLQNTRNYKPKNWQKNMTWRWSNYKDLKNHVCLSLTQLTLKLLSLVTLHWHLPDTVLYDQSWFTDSALSLKLLLTFDKCTNLDRVETAEVKQRIATVNGGCARMNQDNRSCSSMHICELWLFVTHRLETARVRTFPPACSCVKQSGRSIYAMRWLLLKPLKKLNIRPFKNPSR